MKKSELQNPHFSKSPPLEGKGRKAWKKRIEQLERIEESGMGGLWGLTFLHNTKLSSFEELKNCIEGEFWRVYMNSSNLIYIVIIFLKLKI